MERAEREPLIVKNRRAAFDYEIEERYEAGIVLSGSEVKSMRAGKVDVSDAYVAVERGVAWLKQMFVAPFEQASIFQHEPRRNRKLLLHAREVEAIHQALARGGSTAVPLRLYFKNGRVKVEVGVGKGRKTYDKRSVIAERDAEREAGGDAGRARSGCAVTVGVAWARGGEARIVSLTADTIALESTARGLRGRGSRGRWWPRDSCLPARRHRYCGSRSTLPAGGSRAAISSKAGRSILDGACASGSRRGSPSVERLLARGAASAIHCGPR